MLSRLRALAVSLTALLMTVLVAACGAIGGSEGSGETVTSAPAADSVKAADDPRDYSGEIIMDLAQPPLDPVATNPTPALPTTITDNQGTKVEVKDVSRILPLDLYGSISRTVYELGLGDKVVGRDVSSDFAEIKDKPLVTRNGHELNAEAILALNPSVLITDTSLGPWDAVLQVRDAGIPVVVVDSKRNIENIGPLTQSIADAVGLPAEGRALAARTVAATDKSREGIAKLVPKDLDKQLRTIFLYARGQAGVYYIFGENSGADALIDGAGGYDVSKEIGWKGAKPANDEGMVSSQPDVILMMTKGLESVGGVDGLLERFPSLAQTPAGQHRRIIAMPDTQMLSFGGRTPDILNALSVALYSPKSL